MSLESYYCEQCYESFKTPCSEGMEHCPFCGKWGLVHE